MKKAKSGAKLSAMAMLPLKAEANEGELISVRTPPMMLSEMWLADDVRAALDTFVLEHRHAAELAKYGLAPARRALLVGVPGTGKTTAAGALALALELPLLVLSTLTGSFMGASERNVRKVFERMSEAPGLYLIDELDGVGSLRTGQGDGGFKSADKEYNVMLTAMLSCMDMHVGPGILVATTNRLDVIDPALRRRFDLELVFPLPDHDRAIALAKMILADDRDPELVLGPLAGLSQSDVTRLARAERKRRVLAAIVARAAKRASRKSTPPAGAIDGTPDYRSPSEPAAATGGTGNERATQPEPAPAPRGTPMGDLQPTPAAATGGTDTPPSSPKPATAPGGTSSGRPRPAGCYCDSLSPAALRTGDVCGVCERTAPAPAPRGTTSVTSHDQGSLPL